MFIAHKNSSRVCSKEETMDMTESSMRLNTRGYTAPAASVESLPRLMPKSASGHSG